MVLGQMQSSYAGGFKAAQSFQGMLSNVNVWNRVLSATQIKEMSESCLLDGSSDGKIIPWFDFLNSGATPVVKPSPCEPFGIGMLINLLYTRQRMHTTNPVVWCLGFIRFYFIREQFVLINTCWCYTGA